jgi:hypothetical protein
VAAGKRPAQRKETEVITFLRDVIDIPWQAGDEDYVLRLTDSVDDQVVAQTVGDYVVTDALAAAFDQALGLVAESITSGISRGAFLTGSFGSGKSHFMAVLYALLRHNPSARAKPELQPVIARHDDVLRDRNVLPLAYHLLGARSLEQAIFDGYLRQIAERHPRSVLPALHQSDRILADAERLRELNGDERFFAELNGGAGGGSEDPWSALLGSGTWNAETYAAGRAAGPGTQQRQLLVTALAERFFTAYTRQADYVDLDTGLAAIATHAKGLGYDAVTLFLDELVLWLAFSVQDKEFFAREAQKFTKLVEAGTGGRAIPLTSFVARQMDLRQWLADAGASGAEQEALDRAFKHQQGRFATITLGDDNLPYVAHSRLLRRNPANPRADQDLNDAFARLDRRPDVWDVLLDGMNTDERHRGADEAAFRLTYPFSPALISALRNLSGVMQRERTALKVMQRMLVDRRDALTIDDVIPVGDSFDHIVEGQQPLDTQAAALFRSAAALYREKLRPLLLAKYGLTEPEASDPAALPSGFQADDRLIKTLLLSAVAPNVPALKEITASRLASLNHGSIRSPLPGQESSTVLGKVREWAVQVPEIHVAADHANPIIRVHLADVDYETIVERARGEDNDGRRRELIKGLVREALGVRARDLDLAGAITHPVIWRGSRREVDLMFGNVRDPGWLPDDHFLARPGTWRFIIDFPFDQPGRSGTEDHARLDLMTAGGMRSQTIVWLPRFLADERIAEVRRLVILDWLLGGPGERWTGYADHLSEADRVQARAILESQRVGLRDKLRRAIQECYGAAAPTAGNLAPGDPDERVLVSLHSGFSPAAPVGADLGAAFGNLVDQAFSAIYPAHPRFEPSDVEVTVRDLSAVYANVARAVADPEGRVRLEGDIAAVRRVAGPLGVGTVGETHFLFGDDRFAPWSMEFEKAAAKDGIRLQDPVSAERVREWIRALKPPRGLRPEVEDLIILAWAELQQRAWFQHGSPMQPRPRPGQVRVGMELRPEPLPQPAEWKVAVSRVEQIFGAHINPYLTASGVTELAETLGQGAAERTDVTARLSGAIESAYRHLGMPADNAGRLSTAKALADLAESLRRAPDRLSRIRALTLATFPATEAALAKSLSQAVRVSAALGAFHWERLSPLRAAAGQDDERGRAAKAILDKLANAVAADEFAMALPPVLDRTDQAIFDWLAAGQRTPAAAQAPLHSERVPAAPPAREAGQAVRRRGERPDAVLGQLRSFLDGHANDEVIVEWRISE